VKSTSKKQAFLSMLYANIFMHTNISKHNPNTRNVPVEAPVNPPAQNLCARLYVVHGRDCKPRFQQGPSCLVVTLCPIHEYLQCK